MKYLFTLSLVISLICNSFCLHSQDNEFAIKENDKGNRWEGFDSQKISGSFRVVSFLKGTIPQYKLGDILGVEFYVPTGKEASIQAHKLKQGRRKYRMLPKKNVFFEGKQFFTNWPVSDILLKENNNITHDNLGILITTKENIYLPAKILLNNVSNQESGFNVFFYTPYRIDSITCKITDDLYTEVQKITSSRKNPDSKFALSFADLNKSGFYRLAIHVYYSEEKVSGTYSSYDYKFYYNR